MNKKYTKEELFFIESNWGDFSVRRIANRLGRTELAIIQKACKMKLGSRIEYKDYLIATEVVDLLGTNRKTMKLHLEKRGLKNKNKRIGKRVFITIKYEDLISWMKENEKYWNGTKVDKLGLLVIGMEEEYLNNKIKEDTIKENRTSLSEKEIEKIKELYSRFFTYQQIADNLKKEYTTIKWKIHSMIESGEIESNTKKDRLVRVINRENYGWTEKQDEILIKEFKNGKTLKEIAEIVGKSLPATKSRNQVLTKRIIKGMAL